MDAVDYDSPIGKLRLEADRSGLRAIRFPISDDASRNDLVEKPNANPHLANAQRDLDRYFCSDSSFSLQTTLSPKGTPFQISVWTELRKVPSGAVATYGQIARRIGSPNASRAVGLANNRNPIPIFLPCHRIVGAGGKLVGYAGEIWRKEWLLKHEGAII